MEIAPFAILAFVTADAAILEVVTTLSDKIVAISQPAYELCSPVTAPVNLTVFAEVNYFADSTSLGKVISLNVFVVSAAINFNLYPLILKELA